MSYQVLARKWRPRNFQQMLGQEHVLCALMNALDSNRLHHAYLFTGTRGVGKTTVARILAKCLNCEAGVSSKPCGTCSACLDIDQGRFIDLLEVDAASRTKVEDTRALLDNVPYAPTRGRYKIYLIDEVHMLSGHSFNALLKTLEEPPEHVKFLLATTDPKKLPVTVLSRCLQFHMKNLTPEQIQKHLQYILEQENIASEPLALQLLSRSADGSVRDALSLLDQAIAHGGGSVHTDAVTAMLGTIDPTYLWAILEALAERNAQAVIEHYRQLYSQGADFQQALEEILSLLHQIALIQVVPEAIQDLQTDQLRLQQLAARLSPEDVQLYYQIGLIGRRDLPLAPSMASGFEMLLLRMLAFRPVTESIGEKKEIKIIKKEETTEAKIFNWAAVLPQLNLSGLTQTLATHCSLIEAKEDRIQLATTPNYASLLQAKHIDRIAQALTEHLKRPILVEIQATAELSETPAALEKQQHEAKQQQAVKTMQDDPHLQMLVQTFNATIPPDRIKHLEDTNNEHT